MVSKQTLTILLVVVAFVAFYGGFLLGSGAKRVANNHATNSPTPRVTPLPTPAPSNPLGGVKTNPFEGIKFNPFK